MAFSISTRLLERLEKADLDSQQVLLLNSADLRRLANLTESDVEKVKIHCAEQLVAPKFLTGADVQTHFLTTGCKILDEQLGGGFARRGITEVAGESGTGKTQLCLQAALNVQLSPSGGGAGAGAVYICTEDTFPSSRLQQLLQLWPGTHHSEMLAAAKLSDNIFIEHIPDVDSLKNCVCLRLPILLHQQRIGLIVVDSIAGPFRADYDLRQGAVMRAQVIATCPQGEIIKKSRHAWSQGRWSDLCCSSASQGGAGTQCTSTHCASHCRLCAGECALGGAHTSCSLFKS